MMELKHILDTYHIHDVVFADVGAKNTLEYCETLAAITHFHGFEPNPVEYLKLRDRYNINPFKSFQLHELGLSDHNGEAELWITQSNSMSSLLEPDPHNYERHFGSYKEYNRWEKDIKSEKKIYIKLQTADTYFYDFPGAIDYLKIDTQGSELQILEGAKGLLEQQRIYVLKVEVSTIPVYKGQALFSDIDLFLRKYGFILVDFMTYRKEYKPLFESKNQHAHYSPCGDAIYVLSTDQDSENTLIRKSIILNWLGYRSLATHYAKQAGLSAEEIELLEQIPCVHDKPFYKRFIKNMTPPALFHFLKKILWQDGK